MILIAFTGKMGSGKSTAAKTLEEHGFAKFSFAAKLKELATDLFGMKEKDRKLLQDLGTVLRSIEQDVWVKYLIKKLGEHIFNQVSKDLPVRVVVDDMRYLNEAKILRKNGFVLVRLVALNEEARFNWLRDHGTLEGENHPSETEQELIQVDYTLSWSTMEDLEARVLSLVANKLTPKTSTFDVKKNKVELIQFIVDRCVKMIDEKDVGERNRQSYLRILNDCLRTMTRLKELEQITENDLATILSRIPKKARL